MIRRREKQVGGKGKKHTHTHTVSPSVAVSVSFLVTNAALSIIYATKGKLQQADLM